MKNKEENPGDNKISGQFASRLVGLGPDDKIRVIILLTTKSGGQPRARRQNSRQRQAAVKATRRAAGQSLGNIDRILDRFGGKRLAEMPDALGSLPVETTASGISALAKSKSVKAILEDQEIHPVL